MARTPDLDDLAALRSIGDVQLAADGRVAFVVTRHDGETPISSIWIDSRAVTEGPDDRAPRWLPDGSLAFVRGTELRVLPNGIGESVVRLTAERGVLEHAWSPDGSKVAFTSFGEEVEPKAPIVIDRLLHKLDGFGRLSGRSIDVFVHDGETTRRLTECGGLASGLCWVGDDIVFGAGLHADRDLDGASDLWRVPAVGGTVTRITDWSGMVGAPILDRDRLLFVGVPEANPMVHNTVFAVAVDGGKPEDVLADLDRNVLTGGPGYPGAPIALDGRGRLVCVIRDGGSAPLVTIDLTTGERTTLVDGAVTSASVDAASGRVAAVVLTESEPEEVVLTTVDGGAQPRVTHLHDELVSSWTQHPLTERWFAAPDGTRIQGWIRRRADAAGAQPLLVDIHGGPHNAWMPVFDSAHLYHHALAERGWTVLILNPRASDGYGQDFWAATGGAWGEADEDDFLVAIDALVADGVADPDRVAVAGYSYGGFMSAWLIGRSDRFKAAVVGGVVADAHAMHGVSDIAALSLWKEWGARPWEQPDMYTTRSPISRVDRVTTPTLLLHGEADTRCPPGEAERFFAALRARGVPAQLVLYPGASHVFIVNGTLAHRQDYQRRVIDWLERWVGSDAT